MEYRIFPPIGLARIGSSPSFYVSPEVPGSRGREITTAGETEIADFKDANFRVKKQAARFQIFQHATATDPGTPAVLPPGTKIRWTVRVANKKDAIARPVDPPPDIPPGGLRPVLDGARSNRLIDSQDVQIEGVNGSGQFLTGAHVGTSARLGELRTDAEGRLLVLGADGISVSNPPSPIGGSFYTNKNWHDDVGDGTVTADIVFADGTIQKAVGAWVVISPPDFAPGADAIVNLYDVIFQVAVDQGFIPSPTTTSFTRDVYLLLRRARSLKWSHGRRNALGDVVSEANWSAVSDDYPRLAKTDASEGTFRAQNRQRVLNAETLLSQYQLTATQHGHLQRWASGNFTSDWTGVPALSPVVSPDSLTRAALERTAGQGFFPGIEGGRILTDPSIYFSTTFEFRIDPTKISPGDITALMAQPWQADFLKCSGKFGGRRRDRTSRHSQTVL